MVKFLVHKPIAVIMSVLGMVILGTVAINRIPVSLMPDVDIPEITVQVTSKNMSARELEDVIIKPLRNNLIQLSHLEDITSEASNDIGIIRLKFNYGTQIDYSFIEVNEKIDRVMSSLPKNIDRPKVIKASATDIPVFYLNMTLKAKNGNNSGDDLNQDFINFSHFVNTVIRKRIEQIPQVAMVDINGLMSSEISIIPDQKKLISLGVGLEELEKTIKNQNINIGSVLVRDNQYQYNVRLGSSLRTVRDIENIFINKKNKIYRIKDIALVIKRSEKRRGLVLYDDKEAITMAVIKQGNAQMNDLKESLNTLITFMNDEYEEIDFSISRDQTRLLGFAISSLSQSLIWGIVLAFLVMFLFLRDLKSPVLIGISIPVSIIICLFVFEMFDLSINIISLSGLILGIGLMIDNAIIVIDNITQKREKGIGLSEACVIGTNEVVKPLISSVLTTCAVFIPLIFLSGITGALFYDQAIAVTIGLFVSFLVSITILPVLYRLFYLETFKYNKLQLGIKKINKLNYELIYESGFRFVLKKQKLSFGIFMLLCVLSFLLFYVLPKDQMPEISSTETLLKIDWNEPINVDENRLRTLTSITTHEQYIDEYCAFVGSQQFLLNKDSNAKTSETSIYIKTKTTEELVNLKKTLESQVMKEFPNAVMKYEEVENIFNLLFSNDVPPLTARVKSLNNIGIDQKENLIHVWKDIQLQIPDVNLKPIAWSDNIVLIPNKERMVLYGVSPMMLNTILETAFNEKEILTIADNQDFVPVILGSENKNIKRILKETLVKANDSTYYQLNHFVSERSIQKLKTITGSKEGEYFPFDFYINDSEEELVKNKVTSVIKKNKYYDVIFSGKFFNQRKLIKEFTLVLVVTLFLLYFILASQFESFTLPLIILLEIPISMAGALLFLLLFGMSINLMSLIGIVVMSGIIINDSILKIDTIQQLQKQGDGLLKVLLIAGQKRLKPILMTSITTILALFPILFTNSLGGELQAPLAVSLIGGMIVGTIVSLYFIPLCYYHLVKNKTNAS